MVVTSDLSVAAAAAAVAAAAESAFTKLVSRPLLSWGWVGVSVGLGKMLPVRTLRSCVARFRLDTSGWTEPKAGWLDSGCSRLGGMPWVTL